MLTDVQTLAAYLYLMRGQPMPSLVIAEDGKVDIVADDAALTAWSQARDPLSVDVAHLEAFIDQTEELLANLASLELDPEQPAAPQYMTLFYDTARAVFENDLTQLRTYFAWLYMVLFRRDEGPRWGDFVAIYGVDEFSSLVRERFARLI